MKHQIQIRILAALKLSTATVTELQDRLSVKKRDSVAKAVRKLVDAGLVEQRTQVRQGLGAPSWLYGLTP